MPESRYEPFALNDMQQAYWFGRSSGFEGQGVLQYYVEFRTVDFSPKRFNAALNTLIERHDMLRAVIVSDGMQQVIPDPPQVAITVEDLSDLTSDEQEQKRAAIADKMWNSVSDLGAWPQNDFHFLKATSQGTGTLHCRIEMWCLDGRSVQVFFEDLAALYDDPTCKLPPLTLRFRDYLAKVAEEEQSEDYKRSLQYWKERLATLPPPPNLPKSPRSTETDSVGSELFESFNHLLSAEHSRTILDFCTRKGLSLASFLATAYADVLRLWSNQNAFTLNFPRFNRRTDWHEDINNMIGEFASFTLLECQYTPEDTFHERVQKLQEQMWKDLQHSSVSGLRILREMFTESGQADVQAMPYVFTAQPDRRSSANVLENAFATFGTPIESRGSTPQVLIDCQYFLFDDAIRVAWDTQKHAFPEGMVKEMFKAFIDALELLGSEAAFDKRIVVQTPDSHLIPRDRQNNIQRELGDTTGYHKIEEAALKYPGNTALSCDDTDISYKELLTVAKRLALAIELHAEKAETPQHGTPCVAIAMERSWEQYATIVGVMASGLAYVPIDPSSPTDRLTSILEAAAPCLIIANDAVIRKLSDAETPSITFQHLYAGSPEIKNNRSSNFGPAQNAPACIIFTSGSTGTPKGVTIGNDAIVNLINYTNDLFSMSSEDATFAITNIHHDISIYDIYGTLSSGAKLVIPHQQEAHSPKSWLQLACEQSVTYWGSVPVFMEKLLAECAAQGKQLPIKTIALGGDWIDPTILERIETCAPSAKLYPFGGPTETTCLNIINCVTEIDEDWRTVPYGRPIDNASYYILNDELVDVPNWTPGEMYCGGVPLCLSASFNTEENAKAFTTHPKTGERIYRTGDMGRFRPDGMIEILGRKDFQLNIDGFRLSPSEVEQSLSRHPSVKKTVVMGVPLEDSGRLVLTAAIIPNENVDETEFVNEMRQWSNKKLPAAMRPRSWILMEEFPVSRNGKVNRKELIQISAERMQSVQEEHSPPSNPLEEFIAELWTELLSIPIPGVQSSFFELGGDSLKAMRVFSRIKEKIGIELPLSQIFITPTIKGLSMAVYSAISENMEQQQARIKT